MAQVDDPIILDVNQASFDPSDPPQFVRATVDADGVPIVGSPFTVPDVGDGRFFLLDPVNLKFPANRFEVIITYEFFNDAAFTIRSKKNGVAKDGYRLEQAPQNTNPDLINRLNRIISLITELRVLDGEIVEEFLKGDVLENEVEGEISIVNELEGDLIDESIEGMVLEDNEPDGII